MNNNHNDLPTIQCQPTPTDAELQAERDTKHAQAVREWLAQQPTPDDLDHIPAQAVQI